MRKDLSTWYSSELDWSLWEVVILTAVAIGDAVIGSYLIYILVMGYTR